MTDITDLIRQGKLIRFYQSREWLTVRKQALERDHNECQLCKKHGRYRPADCVHHVNEVKPFPMLVLTLSNLMCLCNQCHNAIHDKLPKPEHKVRFMNEERW